MDAADGMAEWLQEGSDKLGARVRRALLAEDGSETVSGYADGTVVGWLPSHLSDFVSDYTKSPAPLWHIKFDSASMGEEDLEEVEVEDAAEAFEKGAWSNAAKSSEASSEFRPTNAAPLALAEKEGMATGASAQSPAAEHASGPDGGSSSAHSTRRKGPRFDAGEMVEALHSSGAWCEAVVAEALADGSFVVTWRDHDERERVKTAADLRKVHGMEPDDRESAEDAGENLQQGLKRGGCAQG